jgi:phosphate uptake regulator
MEKRKLVKSGMFSCTVALPKEWVDRHKLDKGSTVFIEEHDNGLLITPSVEEKREEKKERVINVDKMPSNVVLRDIVASYLTSFGGTIRIQGSELKNNVELYKETIEHQLPGLEVIEETSDTLTAKDFINVGELAVPELIRRTDNIVRGSIEDLHEALANRDEKLAEGIKSRDKEINRLSFLVYKGLNYIAEHPEEGKVHGVHPWCLGYTHELNNSLEKIGDEIKRIAERIIGGGLVKKEVKEIAAMLKIVEEFYIETMTSLYKHDIIRADKIARQRFEMRQQCYKLLSKLKSFDERVIIYRLIYMISITNNISRVIRYVSVEKDKIERGKILATSQSKV